MVTSVLLVDDHADSREVFSTILRHHGFVVSEADDGERGLALTLEAVPSLIVTDLHMPLLDGCAFLRAVKAHPATASVPVIVVTADTSADSRGAAERAGCAAYLIKPLSPATFVSAIRALTQLPSSGSGGGAV